MTAAHLQQRLAELAARGRTALVIYLTVGDPSPEVSLACARAAIAAGADVLELGVPFSDPTADGPVIAAASHRAIARGGSLTRALEVAKALRAESDVPLVLFSYFNPILAFGEERLPLAAIDAGVDACLVVDLPPEEGAALRSAAQRADLAIIPLVAPTTSAAREGDVVRGARGFVYMVSVAGVTGSAEAPLESAARRARALRERSGLPVVVGFGIDSAAKAAGVAAIGVDGVVVGTAIVRAIAEAPSDDESVRRVGALVAELSSALGRGP